MQNQKTKPIQEESTCTVPRSFILLDSVNRSREFDNVTYGIVPDNDTDNKENSIKLENWSGTIMYDDGRDLHIVTLTMKVPMEFPAVPPIVKFESQWLDVERIRKFCNDDGTIVSKYLSAIEWNGKKMGLGEYLMQVYNKLRGR